MTNPTTNQTTMTDAKGIEWTVFTNVTLSTRGDLFGNFTAQFCRELRVRKHAYAQHAEAVTVHFLAPRKRKWRGSTRTPGQRVLVTAGNNESLGQNPFGKPEPGNVSGVTVTKGKHSSCAPAWAIEFQAAVEASAVEILFDWNLER